MSHTVLIVEDEPALLKQIADGFGQAGYTVLAARDGQVGLELFRQSAPDLVITDIVMPGREGMSLIIEIRKANACVPIVAMSGGGSRGCKDYLRWAKELGADLVVQKPFRLSIFLMGVGEMLRAANHPVRPDEAPQFEPAFDPIEDLFEPARAPVPQAAPEPITFSFVK